MFVTLLALPTAFWERPLLRLRIIHFEDNLAGLDAQGTRAVPYAPSYWLALEDGPEAAPPVLQVTDEGGQALAEVASATVGGRAPLSRMVAGQTVRDPVALELPGTLLPGVFDLVAGRRRADGSWLPVRRGPFPLGSVYRMATIRILEQMAP